MRARLARIAAEGAVSAVVAAKIRQRKKDLAGISDNAGLEAFLRCACRHEQCGQFIVTALDQAQGALARDGFARTKVRKNRSTGRARSHVRRRGSSQSHGIPSNGILPRAEAIRG